MTPIVSIIMGSTSDLPVMEKAARFLDEMEIPFEINALSAHRTPREVETFAREAAGRGLRVIIAVKVPVDGMPTKLLQEAIETAVKEDNFELASRLRDELAKR